MNKILISLLVIVLLFLQYKLWFESDEAKQTEQLQKEVAKMEKVNLQLQANNLSLEAEVQDLKQGKQAIAEKARSELGMIKKGETFYQIISKADS